MMVPSEGGEEEKEEDEEVVVVNAVLHGNTCLRQ